MFKWKVFLYTLSMRTKSRESHPFSYRCYLHCLVWSSNRPFIRTLKRLPLTERARLAKLPSICFLKTCLQFDWSSVTSRTVALYFFFLKFNTSSHSLFVIFKFWKKYCINDSKFPSSPLSSTFRPWSKTLYYNVQRHPHLRYNWLWLSVRKT